ncbi:MAG: type I methionyl aminopeptidase [Armatimonadetes bacterium]|nr:MAG: type I methionyl aminopeptidase [Armatimonadota bacterium]
MIFLKRQDEIALMRESGRIVAEALRVMAAAIVPGKTTTKELDEIGEAYIRSQGATPSFKNYRGFPASVCISVNDEVVHGIPSDRVLEEGDIVSLDVGAFKDGFHGDGAWTYPVGRISEEAQRLLNVTRESLMQGIAQCRESRKIGAIGHAVQTYVESNGYSVVRDLTGHGIGRNLHEDPSVPNFGKKGAGPAIKRGMTFCVEPMVNAGTWKVKTLSDGWTVVTADGSLSAHFEHTIAVTEDGPMVLTLPNEA